MTQMKGPARRAEVKTKPLSLRAPTAAILTAMVDLG